MASYDLKHQNQHAHNNFPYELPTYYVNQGWPYDDCWVCVASWMVDGHTQGQPIPPHPQARARIPGVNPGTSKLTLPVSLNGPGGAEDVANVLKAYQVPYHYHAYDSAMSVQDARTLLAKPSDTLVWLGTNFSQWPVKNCDRGFTGKHAVGVFPGADSTNKVMVMDPICDKYYKVDLEKVLKSAEYYAGHDHGHHGHVFLIETVGSGADPCPAGKVRDNQGNCVDPPPPNDKNPEPWYSNQTNQDTAAAAIGGSTAITIILIVVTVVIIGGAYVAFKSGSKVMPVVDRGV